MIGKRFGDFKVSKRYSNASNGLKRFRCECVHCGKKKVFRENAIRFKQACDCQTLPADGKPRTVMEAIRVFGHDEDFSPSKKAKPTSFALGSDDRLEVLRKRVEDGEELWHEEDNLYAGQATNRRDSSTGCSRVRTRIAVDFDSFNCEEEYEV